MTEKKRFFEKLKRFDDIDTILSYLPSQFENVKEEGGIILDQNRIVAIFPKQDIPERMKEVYKRKLGYSIQYITKVLQLFKKENSVRFHFPNKEYPLLIEGDRYLVFIAPQIIESEEEDQE